MGIKAAVEWYSSTLPPTNFTEITMSQATVGTVSGVGWMPISFFILVGGGIVLIYMLVKSLAEALKPCIISEEK